MRRIKKEIKSFGAALSGIRNMRYEAHFKFMLLCTVLAGALMLYLPTTRLEKCVLILCAALILSLEIVNSAIEQLANKVEPKYDQLIKTCKDMAAGAVLLSSAVAIIIAFLIFAPYLWPYCFS